MGQNPDKSPHLTGEQKIQLIDSMRNKGSYEAARERLTATARIIADRHRAAVCRYMLRFAEPRSIFANFHRAAVCRYMLRFAEPRSIFANFHRAAVCRYMLSLVSRLIRLG